VKHEKYQKKFLRHYDGDLTAKERSQIDQHLVECKNCRELYSGIVKIWKADKSASLMKPPQALWFDLKEKVEKIGMKDQSVPSKQSNIRLIFNSAVMLVAFGFAILVGSRFGIAISGQQMNKSEYLFTPKNNADEFGMSFFDLIPPNSVAKNLLMTPSTKKELQK